MAGRGPDALRSYVPDYSRDLSMAYTTDTPYKQDADAVPGTSDRLAVGKMAAAISRL